MINLYDILDAADGQLFGEQSARMFNGFCINPRLVQPGDLFVALKSEGADTHQAMGDAVAAGATGLMCTDPPAFDTSDVTVVVMRDVEAALLNWTTYILRKYGTTVIGVMGSNGKSTTCAAVTQVLQTRYKVYHEATAFRGRFGIPLSLGRLNEADQLVVVELDPAFPGDMAIMASMTEPAVGVVTNINGLDGDANPLYEEARTLVESLPGDGVAVLNYDQPAIYDLRQSAAVPTFTVSVDRDGSSFGADLTAYNLVVALDKTGFDLRHRSQRYIGKWSPLLGAHQVYAILAALGVGLSFGVELDDALTVLTQMHPLPGRMRTLTGRSGAAIIDDSFNADGHSLIAALAWLHEIKPRGSIRETQLGQVSPHGNIYVALGEIDEIDTLQGVSARQIGSALAQVASVLVTEGEAAASLSRTSVDSGFPPTHTHVTYTPQDSARILNDMLGPKDVLLVKGNADARMERLLADLVANETDASALARHQEASRRPSRAATLHQTWLEVDIDAITHNLKRIKKLLAEDCKLLAVVKANAYGHGLGPVASTLAMNGADYLGVTSMEEALELRRSGITLPVLVMNFVAPDAVPQAIKHDLTLTLYDANRARALNRSAGNGSVRAHVRMDIEGDGIGVEPEEAADFFRTMLLLDHIKIEGIYASLDVSNTYQIESKIGTFRQTVVMLRAADFAFDYVHLAGSAAALHIPESHQSLVRVGSALYGIPPDGDLGLPSGFQPAITWKTTVAQVTRIPGRLDMREDGTPVTVGPRLAAVLPIGRMDGFGCCGKVLINGQYADVFTLIGMTHTAVDISGLDDVLIGDEVVLLGTQGNKRITYEEVAQTLGITPTELALTVLPHLPHLG